MDKISEIDELSKKQRVVVMVGASWCGPCKLKKPTFLHLKEKHPQIYMEFIDSDDEPEFKQEHLVKAYPTFIILENCNELRRYEGAKRTMAQLEEWILA
jgi:thiol-disulfide isomerase/thioredoxin